MNLDRFRILGFYLLAHPELKTKVPFVRGISLFEVAYDLFSTSEDLPLVPLPRNHFYSWTCFYGAFLLGLDPHLIVTESYAGLELDIIWQDHRTQLRFAEGRTIPMIRLCMKVAMLTRGYGLKPPMDVAALGRLCIAISEGLDLDKPIPTEIRDYIDNSIVAYNIENPVARV